MMIGEETSHDSLILACTRTGASLELCDLFLELIDPFLERAQSQFPKMVAGGGPFLRFEVEFLHFLPFQPRVLKLVPAVDTRPSAYVLTGPPGLASCWHRLPKR
jgi:hypothetical protein